MSDASVVELWILKQAVCDPLTFRGFRRYWF